MPKSMYMMYTMTLVHGFFNFEKLESVYIGTWSTESTTIGTERENCYWKKGRYLVIEGTHKHMEA